MIARFRQHQSKVLVVSMVLLIGAVLFNSFVRASLVNESSDARAQREAIIDAQVEACERDHAFRVQSRFRGEATRDILSQFISLIAISPVAREHPVESQKVIDRFKLDLARIEILPLPDCVQLRHDLENP